MKPDNRSSILHLKLGGGTRHRTVCAVLGALAPLRGWRVDDFTAYRPQEGQQLPDLVISKTEKVHDGPRIIRKDYRYRIEVIDTHDPIPDGNPGFGFNGVVKVLIADWERRCSSGHDRGDEQGPNPSQFVNEISSRPHFPCYDGLIWLLERSLP